MSVFCRPNRLATTSQEARISLSPKGDECILRVQGRSSAEVPVHVPISSDFAVFGRSEANTLNDKLLVWTPSRVACVDISALKGASDQLIVPSPPHTELVIAADLSRDGDSVVDAQWHPLAAHCILVLTRTRLLAFDTQASSTSPVQDLVLPVRTQQESAGAHKQVHPAALGFGAARGWELLSLYLVYSDGSLFCLCPWLPPGALLFYADWAMLRRDALLAVHDHASARSPAVSANSSSSAPNAAHLHLEWLDVCFRDVHTGSVNLAQSFDGPQYKRYAGPPARHALLGIHARRRWVPSLQGPARLRPELPTPATGTRAPVVDLHVYPPSVATLPMLAMLQSDGHMSVWLACSHIVPSWAAQDQDECVQATLKAAQLTHPETVLADRRAAIQAYALRQVHLKHVSWGQQLLLPPSLLGDGGRGRHDDRGRGVTPTSGCTWVALHAALLPLSQSSGQQGGAAEQENALLQDAAAHVGAGRGTVSGAIGQTGVACLSSTSQNGSPEQLDVLQAPSFYCTHGDWPVPGGVLVVGRHSLHLVSRPSVGLTQEELDSAAEADPMEYNGLASEHSALADNTGADPSRGPLAHLRLHETPLMIIDLLPSGSSAMSEVCEEERDDVCGVAVHGDTVHVWTTALGETINESGFRLQQSGTIHSTSLVQGTVIGKSGSDEGGMSRTGARDVATYGSGMLSLQSLPQAKAFLEETTPFAEVVAPLLKSVREAQANLSASVAAQTAVGPGGGEAGSLGTEVLERVAKASMPLLNAILELHKLHQAVAHRKKLLALVAEQSLSLAQAARIHSSASQAGLAVRELAERAEAARECMQARLARAKAIEQHLFGEDSGSSSVGSGDGSADNRMRELKAVLRELTVSCRTSVALLDLKLESLHATVDAFTPTTTDEVSVTVGQEWRGEKRSMIGERSTVQDLKAYAEAVQERITAVATQQEASQLAIRTLTTAVESAAGGAGAGARLEAKQLTVVGDQTQRKEALARPRRFNRAGLPMSPM